MTMVATRAAFSCSLFRCRTLPDHIGPHVVTQGCHAGQRQAGHDRQHGGEGADEAEEGVAADLQVPEAAPPFAAATGLGHDLRPDQHHGANPMMKTIRWKKPIRPVA